MPTLDGRQYAVDSVVCQHKSTGVRRSAADGIDVVDSVPAAATIDYEGVGFAGRFSGFELVDPPMPFIEGLLPLKPGRVLTRKLTRTVPPVWHSASNRSRGCVGTL